jgi:hypothetical protein
MARPIDFSRKRETVEIIADSFVFLRTESRQLLKITAVYILPFLIIYTAAQLYMQSKYAGFLELALKKEPDQLVREAGPFYLNLLITLGFNVFVQSLFCAVIFTYVQAYIFKGRNNFSLQDITPVFFTNTLFTLATGFTVTIASLSGLFLCIIPGIILANSLSLAVFIAVYERKGVMNALIRSWYLVRGHWWGTLGLNMLGILIIWITGNILSLPVALAGGENIFSSPPGGIKEMASDWRWWMAGGSILFSTVASVVSYLFWALQYFNLSVREKEASGR